MTAPGSRADAFDRVARVIAHETGRDTRAITGRTDLSHDLGLTRRDARRLFEALDQVRAIDWAGFDANEQFGDTRCALPAPWHMEESRLLYRTPPFRVDDVVRAVETGRWRHRPLELRPAWQRALLWSACLVQVVMIAAPLGAIVLALFLR